MINFYRADARVIADVCKIWNFARISHRWPFSTLLSASGRLAPGSAVRRGDSSRRSYPSARRSTWAALQVREIRFTRARRLVVYGQLMSCFLLVVSDLETGTYLLSFFFGWKIDREIVKQGATQTKEPLCCDAQRDSTRQREIESQTNR